MTIFLTLFLHLLRILNFFTDSSLKVSESGCNWTYGSNQGDQLYCSQSGNMVEYCYCIASISKLYVPKMWSVCTACVRTIITVYIYAAANDKQLLTNHCTLIDHNLLFLVGAGWQVRI